MHEYYLSLLRRFVCDIRCPGPNQCLACAADVCLRRCKIRTALAFVLVLIHSPFTTHPDYMAIMVMYKFVRFPSCFAGESTRQPTCSSPMWVRCGLKRSSAS